MSEAQSHSRYVLWGLLGILAVFVAYVISVNLLEKRRLDESYQKQQEAQGTIENPKGPGVDLDNFRKRMRELDREENPPIDWDAVEKDIKRPK